MPEQTPAQLPGSGGSAGRREALEAADAGQVDAVQDHLELAGAEFQPGGPGGGVREVIAAREPRAPGSGAVGEVPLEQDAVSGERVEVRRRDPEVGWQSPAPRN